MLRVTISLTETDRDEVGDLVIEVSRVTDDDKERDDAALNVGDGFGGTVSVDVGASEAECVGDTVGGSSLD